jgi:plastocyanin
MKRLLAAAIISAVMLTAVAVALGATTLKVKTAKVAWTYNVKALAAKPGKVTISMTNSSALFRHDVALRAGTTAKSKLITKGKVVGKNGVSKITVPVKKGKYRFFCTVKGHEAGGMWGILTVK